MQGQWHVLMSIIIKKQIYIWKEMKIVLELGAKANCLACFWVRNSLFNWELTKHVTGNSYILLPYLISK